MTYFSPTRVTCSESSLHLCHAPKQLFSSADDTLVQYRCLFGKHLTRSCWRGPVWVPRSWSRQCDHRLFSSQGFWYFWHLKPGWIQLGHLSSWNRTGIQVCWADLNGSGSETHLNFDFNMDISWWHVLTDFLKSHFALVLPTLKVMFIGITDFTGFTRCTEGGRHHREIWHSCLCFWRRSWR